MRRSALRYELPEELIARAPLAERDASRLLVLGRRSGAIAHHSFRDLVEYLRSGDLLVLNDTQVIPARFYAQRATGGRIEGLFLQEQGGEWQVLLKGAARLRAGERLRLMRGSDGAGPELELLIRLERGEWRVRPLAAGSAVTLLQQFGETPLPPYIRAARRHDDAAESTVSDETRYQTVYAEKPGAIAAPTAGLHFSATLLEALARRGVRRAFVTLHVGAGTFAPLEVDELRDHAMHAEWFELTAATRAAVAQTRAAGGRVIAVGTTSCRVLESAARVATGGAGDGALGAACGDGGVAGWTRLFLYPPAEFHWTDGLITNFHLPESTLLALVMAYAGVEAIRTAYATAIAERYRFFSYGDAMLIL